MAFRSSSPLGWPAGVSALLHAMGLAAILLPVERSPLEPAPTGAMVELRLVETQGAVPVPQPAEPEPVTPPEATPPIPSRPPQLNLAGDSLTNVLASGPGVLPARVDARWHNREPVYPLDAAQRRAVLLLTHVAPDGTVAGVDVAESSGFPRLDTAARMAVETWHFLPAVHDGQPLASDMPLRVVFQLN